MQPPSAPRFLLTVQPIKTPSCPSVPLIRILIRLPMTDCQVQGQRPGHGFESPHRCHLPDPWLHRPFPDCPVPGPQALVLPALGSLLCLRGTPGAPSGWLQDSLTWSAVPGFTASPKLKMHLYLLFIVCHLFCEAFSTTSFPRSAYPWDQHAFV